MNNKELFDYAKLERPHPHSQALKKSHYSFAMDCLTVS